LGEFSGRVQFGDRATLNAFGKDHAPPDFLRPQIIDQTLEMNRTSGGYDLLEVGFLSADPPERFRPKE